MSLTRTTTVHPPLLNVADARQMTGSAYMNRKEAAAHMCVSEKYLATHLHDGPKRLKVGSKVIYRLSDLENFMRQREVHS